MSKFIESLVKSLTLANTPYSQRDLGAAEGVYLPEDFLEFVLTGKEKYKSWKTIFNAHRSAAWKLGPTDSPWQLKDCLVLESGKGYQPGFDAFFEGPTIADCGMVLQAAIAQYFLEATGDVLFHRSVENLMGSLMLTSHLFERRSNNTRLNESNPWSESFEVIASTRGDTSDSPLDEDIIQVGDILFIGGARGYEKKHLLGSGGGWYVICVDESSKGIKSYLGFGPEQFQQPLTLEEIQAFLLEAYNAEQNPSCKMSIEQAIIEDNNPEIERGKSTEDYIQRAKMARNIANSKTYKTSIRGICHVMRLIDAEVA